MMLNVSSNVQYYCNRTYVELKSCFAKASMIKKHCNRTYVELKSKWKRLSLQLGRNCNRTYVELKLSSMVRVL